MDNKENNELIARFLGYEQNHLKHPTYWFNEDDKTVLPILIFDSSFDWIMPVVQKILSDKFIRRILNEF